MQESVIRSSVSQIRTGSDPDQLAAYVLGRFDAPAFVRRARRVADAYELILERCRCRRNELLGPVRRAVARLRALAAPGPTIDGGTLHPDEQAKIGIIQGAVEIAEPAVRPINRGRRCVSAIRDLAHAIARFNSQWTAFVEVLDLAEINALRDGYNRYYLLEKECALKSAVLAQIGFQPMPPLERSDVTAHFPLLPIPAPRFTRRGLAESVE